MASSELSSSELLRRPLTLERVASVPADASVRHVDQLDAETLETFYDAVEGDRATLETDAETDHDLETGEIIVFTDYYRVVRL